MDGKELQNMPDTYEQKYIGYLGHDPELFNDSVENNVLMGEQKDRGFPAKWFAWQKK